MRHSNPLVSSLTDCTSGVVYWNKGPDLVLAEARVFLLVSSLPRISAPIPVFSYPEVPDI